MSEVVEEQEGEWVDVTPVEEGPGYQLTILLALARMNKHVYEGTVSASKIKKARARNKVARAQRKRNKRG